MECPVSGLLQNDKAYSLYRLKGVDLFNVQTLMVADGCNVACTYCWYETGSEEYLPVDVSVEGYMRWFRLCAQSDAPVHAISLTGGGEPLLCPDFCQLVDALSAMAPVSVFTNGILLRDGVLEALDRNSVEVHVSIDHIDSTLPDRVRGGTGATLAGVRRLAELHSYTGKLCMVITSRNWTQVLPVAELAEQSGFDLEFIPVSVPSQHPLSLSQLTLESRTQLSMWVAQCDQHPGMSVYCAKLRKYLRDLKPPKAISCKAVTQGIYIDSRRDVFLCPQRSDEKLGNITIDSPQQISDVKNSLIRKKSAGPCVKLDCLVVAA